MTCCKKISEECGFTLIELVVIVIIVGILAVVTLPRMDNGSTFREAGLRDQTASALRYAQKTAVSHRRLVCATVAGNQLSLAIAADFGDAACAISLAGADGKQPAAESQYAGITLISSASPLYFQPSGAVTSDAAGSTPTNFNLTVSNLTVTNQPVIIVHGATGHVE